MKHSLKWLLLAGTAVALIACACVGSAWSYFTTYAEAKGGYTIELGTETEITEEFYDWTKHVVISTNELSMPVYIRAIAYSGSQYPLTYSSADGKWNEGSDGYWYFSDPVPAGASTSELLVKINDVPSEVKEKTNFNVVVIYESTPVLYDEDGNPYADWSVTLDTGADAAES